MRFISPKVHGVIDYLVVLFLLVSPTIFGFTGIIAISTYALAAVHLILTLLTNFDAGLFKVIPFRLHGAIEFIVGIALIILAFTLFMYNETGRVFYTCFGLAVLLTWLFTDYRNINNL